jgi:hypothetical protein
MMKYLMMTLLLGGLLGTACQLDQASLADQQHWQLAVANTHKIHMDTLANFQFTRSLQLWVAGEDRRLVNLNILHPALEFYDYATGQLLKRIPLEAEGPNGIGQIDGNLTFRVLSEDRIAFINNWLGYLLLMDGAGEIIARHPFAEELMEMGANPEGMTFQPVLWEDDHYLCSLYPFGPGVTDFRFAKIPAVLKMHHESLAKSYPVFYPPIYDQHFWGMNNFKYRAHFVSLAGDDELLVSFPVSHYVYHYRSGQLVDSILVRSQRLPESIVPMEEQPMRELLQQTSYRLDMDMSDDYALTNSDYGSLLHDPRTGYFLRMVNYRPTKDAYQQFGGRPDIGFIIFSRDGEVLGETPLPSGAYRFELFFIDEEGLHIARVPTREGELIFDVFQITPST